MTNEEILEQIKNVITTLHPYMDNRLPILLNYPNPSMDIDFFFHPNGTTIMFSDGLETSKKSISKKIELDFTTEPALINSLIEMLLQDHDYISDIKKSKDTLTVGTDVELSLDNCAGISCGDINVVLDFSRYPNGEVLLNGYYDAIVCAFYDQVKNTPTFKYQFGDEGVTVKRDLTEKLSKEEMLNILSGLSEEELHKIINGLPVPVFMKAYQDSGTKLTRREPNI